MKSIPHPDGRTLYFGRRRPLVRGPRMKLGNYLLKTLPEPPAAFDYSPAASAALSQVYLNDQLGDCVIACMAHTEGVLTGNATGTPTIFTADEITQEYGAVGGYVPGNASTDNGCDEVTALNYWQEKGFCGHKLFGWMSVNGAVPSEYLTGLWLFEALMFGIELPNGWIDPFPSAPDFVWDAAGDPDPENGHCIGGFGARPDGAVKISTWGMKGWITPAAIAKYATTPGQGELYVPVSQEVITRASQKAPSGFDWSQLMADFDSMRA